MELNKNSLTAKTYRWFYNKKLHEMPTNLCPYFWKLVLMWITFIPSILLSLPYTVFTTIDKDEKTEHNPAVGLIIWLFLFILQCIFIAFGYLFFEYEKDSYLGSCAVGGFFAIILLSILGIIELIRYLNKRTNKSERKQSNIIIEFVKAKYNKYCPQITWKTK